MGALADKVDNMPDDHLTPQEPSNGGETTGGANPKESGSGGDTNAGTTGDNKPDEAGTGGADKGSEADKGGAGKTDPSEDGYLADAGDDDGSKPAPVEVGAAPVPTGLSPDLQYVVDNLPTLAVRGKTSADGPVRTFQIKAAGQLPEEFEFASKREELLFNQSIVGQEVRARELQSEFKQREQNKAATDFAEKENKDIRAGIGSLQREGKLDRFKYEPDDPKFADDPPVKEAQEAIDYMNKRNAQYLDAANKGGVLYHLSFQDAYTQLQASKGSTGSSAQDKEDKERKGVARATAGSAGAPSTGLSKPRAARSMQELMDRIEASEY